MQTEQQVRIDAPRPRLFLECTSTFQSHISTGIQRVVRNVVNCALDLADELPFEPVPVVFKDDALHRVGKLSPRPARSMQSARRYFNNIYFQFAGLVCAVFPFGPVRRFMFAGKREFGLVRILLAPALLASALRARMKRTGHGTTQAAGEAATRSDVLLLLDASWTSDLWSAAEQARARGATVFGLIYDIIPLRHPEYFPPHMAAAYARWFGRLREHVDGFICISDAVKNDLVHYLGSSPEADPGRYLGFASFRLGSELDGSKPGERVREEIAQLFADDAHSSVYLMVGTLEPRKNHAFVLDAFERLWRTRPTVKLLIAGRIGWHCEELLRRLSTHPMCRHALFVHHDLTDSELDHCYRHARALVIPSFEEGFGLPIVEALQRGLPVFASDIPVFREVGGEHVAYFDLASPESLARAIDRFEEQGAFPSAVDFRSYRWIGWDDSTRELVIKVAGLVSGASASRTV